jgi:hypothetical protein
MACHSALASQYLQNGNVDFDGNVGAIDRIPDIFADRGLLDGPPPALVNRVLSPV